MVALDRPINPEHKAAIIERYKAACALNDVDAMPEFTAIRQRAYELGYTLQQLLDIYAEVRNDKPKSVVAVASKEIPPEKELTEKQHKEFSRRVEQSYETQPGFTPSGTRKSGAAKGKSIVDGIL